MARLVPPLDDTPKRWAELRRTDRPRSVRFDGDRGLIHLEEQLLPPWWVYALVAVHEDHVALVEVRTFPSVERDEYFRVRDEVYERWSRAKEHDPGRGQIAPGDYDRLRAARKRCPKWGEWRLTKANLTAAGVGLPGTVLARVRPAALVATAQAECDYIVRRFGEGTTVAVGVLTAGPITPGRGPKSDLYYARLAAEYSAILAGGGSDSSRPLVVMAQRRGWESKRGRDKMRDEVKECRNRLMLPSVGEHAGRAVGTLTRRALRLLQEGA